MDSFKDEILKAVKHPNVTKFLNQANGKLVSSEQQMKKGTMVLEFEDGHQWLAYVNGYLRETNQGAGSDLKIVTKPKPDFTYDNMGLDFYTQYAIENFQKRIDKRRKSGKKKLEELKKNKHRLAIAVLGFVFNSAEHAVKDVSTIEDYMTLEGFSNPDYQFLNTKKLYETYGSSKSRDKLVFNHSEFITNKRLKIAQDVIKKHNLNVDGIDISSIESIMKSHFFRKRERQIIIDVFNHSYYPAMWS